MCSIIEIFGFCYQEFSDIKRGLSRLVSRVLNLVMQPSGFSEFVNQLERKMKLVGSGHDRTLTFFLLCSKYCLVLLIL